MCGLPKTSSGTLIRATGAMPEERRTDIIYGWNDDVRGMKLVF